MNIYKAFIISVLFVCTIFPSFSNVSNNKFNVKKTNHKIKIDGILENGEWDSAFKINLNYEIDPGNNIKPPVKTVAYVTYDSDNLYVSFIAYDDKPGEIRANFSDRDSSYRDDFVGIALDPFNDERRGYEFFVNPYGVQMDLKRTESNGEDSSWDTIWDSAGQITDYGYVVEFAIPFKSISFPKTAEIQTWGFWAFRSYPRNFRYQISSTKFDRNTNCFFCNISKMTGLKNIKPGRNLEINPSMVVINSQERADYNEPLLRNGTTSQIGANIRWAPTSNLTINSTFNPDFSQVEADSVQLSINRNYSLFYREKRPFFLEEADIFDTPSRLIHTRTISDPSFGAKVTGKSNSYTYGAFYAEDTVTNYLVPSSTGSYLSTFEHSSNAIVLRGKKDIFTNSNIGAVLTSRSGGGYHNTVIGIDGNIYLNKQDSIVFQALKSDTKNPYVESDDEFDGRKFDGNFLTLRYEHDSEKWNWDLGYDRRDKDFRADLGFIGQVDVESFNGSLHYTIYGKDGAFISRIRPGMFVNFEKDLSGNVLGRTLHLQTQFNMAAQSYFGMYYNANMNYYDTLNHYYNNYGMWAGTRPYSFLSIYFNANLGETIDYSNNRLGRKRRFRTEFDIKPDEHLKINLEIMQEKLLEYDSYLYKADVLQGNFVYNFSKRLFARTIVQYTHIKRNVELYIDKPSSDRFKSVYSQFLINYKINPRTLCYLGFSAGRSANELYPMQTMNKAIFFKIAYAFRM